MIRNIDVLKKIKEKANKFLIISDGVDVTLDIEDANLTELVSEEDEEVLEMLESAESIEILIMQLTEDLRDALDYDGFDCESYSWCLSKIRHNTMEIENYYRSICSAIRSIYENIQKMLYGNKILMQYACVENVKATMPGQE